MSFVHSPLIVLFSALVTPSVLVAQDSRLFGSVTLRGVKNGAMALSSDGKLAVIGLNTGQATIFDPLPGKILIYEPFSSHAKAVTVIAFKPDDQWFATAGAEGDVKLWETFTAAKFQTDNQNRQEGMPKPLPPQAKHHLKAAHAGGVTSLVFSPDGTRLATAGKDGVVKIWNTTTAKLESTLAADKGGVLCVAFAPDGYSLAASGVDKTFKIWKLREIDRPPVVSALHQGPVLAVAFSPDGKQLASGSGEPNKSGQLQLWDLETLKPILDLGPLTDVVTTLSFHPTQPRLASGGKDKRVRIWSLTTKKQLYDEFHADVLIKISYTTEGRLLGTMCSLEGKWWNGLPDLK